MKHNSCLFWRIVRGLALCHSVWEDRWHLAFFSNFPNADGVAVVITNRHHPSSSFDLARSVLLGLVLAAGTVARLLDRKMKDKGRTAMGFEGFGLEHVHAKLFPMHGAR